MSNTVFHCIGISPTFYVNFIETYQQITLVSLCQNSLPQNSIFTHNQYFVYPALARIQATYQRLAEIITFPIALRNIFPLMDKSTCSLHNEHI